MRLNKQAKTLSGGTPDLSQLEKINAQSRQPMKAEEVYVFSVRLCDDQVDRDGERFDTEALPVLGQMFIGKPGIVDHNWSAEKQVARIFDTEVVEENGLKWLKAWAYMPRMGREELISDIESGIRKEVSISCSMKERVCSICGGAVGSCGHQIGQVFDGKLCCAVLREPQDAYEFSFVAVPAQPHAGVVKRWKGGGEETLRAFVEKSGSASVQQEWKELSEMAEFGRNRRGWLLGEVTRMGTALELGLSEKALRFLAETLEPSALETFHTALAEKMEKRYGGGPQLGLTALSHEDGEAYQI